MAADRGHSRSDEKQMGQDVNYDPNLDFYSDQFDPLKALHTSNIVPPVPDAKTYDNIFAYKRAYSAEKDQRPRKHVTAESEAGKSEFKRNWLPHQLPIQSERKHHRVKNVLTKMESTRGPLSVLRKCIEDKIKVKIWTRHSHGIRGYITAFVTMFDKHWNMSLEDVVEVWTRPKKRKVPPFGTINADKPPVDVDNSDRCFPKVTVLKTEKKLETCRRQLDQLFVRGEQIAYVCILKDYDA
ncbi:U7 snRNA-associated Sm-like protein LSm11 [Agrilus planipennis]|uniref:U7 snRNA-associated Sm-like protein LSm11 n=1 Tax=Agrilus planipennis TaxID=224129 RepID=A0A1W4WL90_AGRPL|nr:U7 snRNA-associated Sm-like protein LSm11 [Agrilus planipennis]